MYSALLFEMLAESRLAEVAATAERRGTEHKPERTPSPAVPLAWKQVRCVVGASILGPVTTFREFVHALRTNRSSAVEPH
jgi:hypothetical protein